MTTPIAAGPIDRSGWGDATCRRCGGAMLHSKAIAQTYGGIPDFAAGQVVTMSPEGHGQLIDCLKCERCGHSIHP